MDPSAQEILDAWNQALYDVRHPKPAKPVCDCGSTTANVNVFGRGWYCGNRHRLPGQDMPK
jgi:hypothetical protein